MLGSGCYSGANGGAGGETDSGGSEGEEETDGEDTRGGGSDSDDDDGPFDCDPDAIPDSLSMRRLSAVQYRNTVRDVVEWAIGPDADAVFDQLEPTIGLMPSDVRQAAHGGVRGGFRRVDQNVHQQHIDVSYEVAIATASQLTENHLESVAGACAVDADLSNDGSCIDDFIRRFGERTYRRPLDETEVEFYHEVFDAQGATEGVEPDAFADVIAVMMTSPAFLYMVEHGEDPEPGAPDLYRLAPHELAQRLSYQFWQGPPDDALREAARSGELATDAGYEAQVDRLLDDPKAAAAVREFYGEWFWLEDLSAIDARVGTPVYDAILDGFEVQPETTQNMIDEVLDMAAYYTFDADGSFEEFFSSDRSFATTPDLAAIYGVPVWSGGEPPAFPQPERSGLITRAAFVATGSVTTRPIVKGVRIREAMLCEELLPPPPGASTTLPELSPEFTTRELVEELTEQQGSQCAGCHAFQINPLGFITENFDQIGRYRTEQVLYDENGNVTGSRPIDTATQPRVDLTDDTPASTAAEATQLLLQSERLQSCFARNYVRWTFGRDEEEAQDGCMLNAMTSNLIEGASIRDVLRQLALRDEFKTRKIEE